MGGIVVEEGDVMITPEVERAVLSALGKKAAAARRREVKTCARPGCFVQFEGTKRALYCSDNCRAAVHYQGNSERLNRARVERRRHRAAPAPSDATGPESGT